MSLVHYVGFASWYYTLARAGGQHFSDGAWKKGCPAVALQPKSMLDSQLYHWGIQGQGGL